VSFVIIYNKRCDRRNSVQDVLPGSEFCGEAPYVNLKKRIAGTDTVHDQVTNESL